MNKDKFKKLLKLFHKYSDRHVLVAETDMSYCDIQKVVLISDKLRRAGNRLVAIMLKNYNQLMRTKRYRKLLKLYGATKDKAKRKELAKQLNEMQEQYNVTWDFCRKSMIPIAYRYKLNSIFALTKAEDIWFGVEKCLYGNGKTIHSSKYGDLSSIRAKQINRGILISIKNDELKFKIGNISFGIQVNDRFQQDTVSAVLFYLNNTEEVDKKAVETFLDKDICIDN